MKNIALIALAALLVSCKPPAQSTRTFVDEDECEAAGMSDSFCDAMFPEVEDFFEKKKKKPKPTFKTSKPSIKIKKTNRNK